MTNKLTKETKPLKKMEEQVISKEIITVNAVSNKQSSNKNEVKMKSKTNTSKSSLINSLTKNQEPKMKSKKSQQEEETNEAEFSPNQNIEVEEKEPRFRRADARKTASIRNSRLQKKAKLRNLRKQLADLRAILKRGYYIQTKEVDTEDGRKEIKSFLKLDGAEREFLRKKRNQIKIQILLLGDQIDDYTEDLRDQSYRTKMSFSNKYSKLIKNNKIKKTTRRISGLIQKQMLEDAKNGMKEKLSRIKNMTDEEEKIQNMKDYVNKILPKDQVRFIQIPEVCESVAKRSLSHLQDIDFN